MAQITSRPATANLRVDESGPAQGARIHDYRFGSGPERRLLQQVQNGRAEARSRRRPEGEIKRFPGGGQRTGTLHPLATIFSAFMFGR